MSVKVMIVEDESIVAMELSSLVTELGYVVVGRASNGADGFTLCVEEAPDIVLMDVHLKGTEDGISLAHRIQKHKSCSIIYITAFNDDASLERAIETDPAAYLTKPFNRKELSASLKIAAKRVSRETEQERIGKIKIDHEFSYDPDSRQLLCCGEFIHLTRKELELLALLLESKEQIVDLYSIENRLWPEKAPNENTRRGLVARLRSKLNIQFIETIPGQGYRMHYHSA